MYLYTTIIIYKAAQRLRRSHILHATTCEYTRLCADEKKVLKPHRSRDFISDVG